MFRKMALGTILPTLAFNSSAQKNYMPLAQSGYYHMALHDTYMIALSDGSITQNTDKLLINVKPGEVKTLSNLHFQKPVVKLSVNTYLFRLNEKLMRIDADTSELFGPTLGYLPESFARAGFRTEDVDDVLITHIHSDPMGGSELAVGQLVQPVAFSM